MATRRGESQVIRLSFDALNRPFRRTRGERERGYREVTFDYDSAGNLVRVTRGSGSEASATRTAYDGYDRLVGIELPNGTPVRFSRDPNGNVLRQETRGARDAQPVLDVRQAFDAKGRLVRRSTVDATGTDLIFEIWHGRPRPFL